MSESAAPASTGEPRTWLARGTLSVAALSFVASVSSIANDFTGDDRPLIDLNANVHSLAHWWRLFGSSYWPASAEAGLYRPVTMLAFALQWALGGSPVVFHATSIVLYVCCSVLVYRLARRLAGQTAAWIAGAVFAVHPVHVEAVGNIVGQSELIAALAILIATLTYVRWLQTPHTADRAPSVRMVAALAAVYAIGIFAKEGAIVLPVLLVAVHVHVRKRLPGHQAVRVRAVRPTYLVLIATGLAALWARAAVLGGIPIAPNTALDGLTVSQRIATMLGVVPEWLRLFVWPSRLIPVYSPPYVHIAHGFGAEAVPGVLILTAALLLAIRAARQPDTHAITLGLEWMAIGLAPVSNIVIATGILLAERTLFLPSVGFCIAIGAAADWLIGRVTQRRLASVLELAGATLLALALGRSIVHQRVWASDGSLITAAITSAPNSYVLDVMYADYAMRQGDAAVAERWYQNAIRLYPQDPTPYISLGELYVQTQRFDRALLAFTMAMRRDRDNTDARAGMIVALDRLGKFPQARQLARGGIAAGGDDEPSFRRLLALTDSLAASHSSNSPDSASREHPRR